MRSGSLYLGEGDELRLLRPLRYPNSLGWFYSCITELLGFHARRDEHKVQWLSKDGQPDFVSSFRKLFQWDSAGLPVLNTRYGALFFRGWPGACTLRSRCRRKPPHGSLPAPQVWRARSRPGALQYLLQSFWRAAGLRSPEAIRSFYCAGIDALAIGDFFIVK